MAVSSITFAPAKIVRALLQAGCVRRAFSFFEEQAEEIDDLHAEICSIPAPPFGEERRARYLRGRLAQVEPDELELDEEGNVIALLRGRSLFPLLVLSAHIDTVFPPNTDFTVRREGRILRAPGIADDGCGLAALIALAEAIRRYEIKTKGSLLFVGTVGEEGEGNLRGVRHLLLKGRWAGRIDSFISLDGAGLERITNGALGSRRFRVRFIGAGGHSWGDFGIANPIHALGRAIARLVVYPTPLRPRTSFNVGRIEGGAGVNVIAREATMDVDLRSESAEELARLTNFFHRTVAEAAAAENGARASSAPPIEFEIELIGERPGGETPAESTLVRLAREATRVFGIDPFLDRASTDANIAISMGIPAITIGVGGTSGNVHTLNEWYDPHGREEGLKRALLIALGIAGLG
jgi:tripeptide aminopeptidase